MMACLTTTITRIMHTNTFIKWLIKIYTKLNTILRKLSTLHDKSKYVPRQF